MEYVIEYETTDISRLPLLVQTTNAEQFGPYPPGTMLILGFYLEWRVVTLFSSMQSVCRVKADVAPTSLPWYNQASWNFPADAKVTPPLPVDVPVSAASGTRGNGLEK